MQLLNEKTEKMNIFCVAAYLLAWRTVSIHAVFTVACALCAVFISM